MPKMFSFRNEQNASAYEEMYKEGYNHLYPNENIVRLVKWFWGVGGRVLDYGFGSGENLLHLLKEGYVCEGIEVSDNALVLVKNKLGNYPQFEGKYNLHILGGELGHLPCPGCRRAQ